MSSEMDILMRWLYRRQFTARAYVFDSLLLDAAFSLFGKPPLDAHAFVHRNAITYWRKIVERLQEEKRTGRTPLFDILDNTSRRITWPPARYSASHQKKKLFRRLIGRPGVLQAIDHLTPREYEALPCLLVDLIGSNKHHVTPAGDEWGVDFFATLRNPSQLSVFDGCRVPIRLVGQCKKYETRLEVAEVKEFSRTLDALRNCKPELERQVPAWFRSGMGPIVPWVISHSGFQRGALSFARDEGMVASDSIDLAECFCLIRLSQPLAGVSEKRDFIQKRCQQIVG